MIPLEKFLLLVKKKKKLSGVSNSVFEETYVEQCPSTILLKEEAIFNFDIVRDFDCTVS